MAWKVFKNIPQEVGAVKPESRTQHRWTVISYQRLSPKLKSFAGIGFCDHMMQRANQMTGWVMTQSSGKSIISRPGDDGMAARVPSGKGKGTWFCVSVSVRVCVRARAVTPVCPCYTFTIPAILRHIPAVIARGQRVAEGADCWDAWRWCLHAVAVSSVTLTYSWWGLIKYAHISNGWASHCHHSHMIMEATSPYIFFK